MKLDPQQMQARLGGVLNGIKSIIPLGNHSPEGGQNVHRWVLEHRRPSLIDQFRPQAVRAAAHAKPKQPQKTSGFPF